MEQLYRDGAPITDQTAPNGPIDERWDTRRFNTRLVNPTNRRRLSVIIVGTGLAGASAAATLGEGGYQVKDFCYEDSPRRAHSIAAQGGINAAKNYRNDGDSIYRLFYDTIKGRGLPLPRVQRLSARPSQPRNHRPVRGTGRALRPRVRRRAG
jgi:succinate dehydrogenase / fumarate reductase flavoprotein subunit